MGKKEIKVKECKHKVDFMPDICSRCGYGEDTCVKCKQEVYTDNGGEYWVLV